MNMSGGDAGDKAEKKPVTPEKIAGRKKRVALVYRILMTETALFSGVIYAKSRNPFYAVGPLLACAVSHVLLGAAGEDRLASDTYKRLNLGLGTYGLVALFAGICMGFPKIWAVSCVIAMINTIKGYGYGLKGWELAPANAVGDLLGGWKSNFRSMVKIPTLKSAGYLAGTGVVGALTLAKVREVAEIITTGAGTYKLGQRLFRLSMFMILTVIMFTLKDAADRDRLDGSTFVELNGVASISFAAWAWEAYSGAAFAPLGVGASLALSLFSASNGLVSILKKK